MSEQIAPASNYQSSRRISVKRHSIGLGARDGVVFNYQTIDQSTSFSTPSVKIEYFLSHRWTALVLSTLIIVYSLLVVIRIAFESEVNSVSTELDILELVFLSIFVLELFLRIFAYKIIFFKYFWNLFDMIIIIVCLLVIIASLSNSSITQSLAFKLGKVLRIFRLFLMFRKMNTMRKYKDKIVKVKNAAVNLTSPSEKVIEVLSTILELEWISYQTQLKTDIEWSIHMIKEQKIYQTNIRAVKEELRDLVNWAVNQNQFEDESDTPMKTETYVNLVAIEHYGQEVESILKDCHNWDFDIFKLEKSSENKSLEIITTHLFSLYNLFHTLSLDNTKFNNFIQAIQSGYHKENPYHNSLHAADVVQSYYYFLHSCQAIEIASLADFEIGVCLISAAIHDYDHPGLNNLFLINSNDSLALTYNDKSVLENFHVASAFKLLMTEKFNFIENFSKDDKKKFRFKTISVVLATDFARHFADLGKFQLKFSNATVKDDEDRMIVMEMLMHASDVGNPSRPWKNCYEWAVRVMNEFFVQGDKEREMGLPISNLCDRFTVSVPKSQIGFTELFIEPTFNLLVNLFPAVAENLRIIAENKEKWKELMENGKQ